MNDEIKKIIAEAATKLNEDHAKFWHEGEIPALIAGRTINALAHGRIKRVREWLLSNGHPVHDHQLKQLMLWEARTNKALATAATGFKLLLLQAAEENGEEWTKKIDKAADFHAKKIVAENVHRINKADR